MRNKPRFRLLARVGDYDRYLVSVGGEFIEWMYTNKYGETLEQFFIKAGKFNA